MSRSRSSFDVSKAIATVRAITETDSSDALPKSRLPPQFEGVALVSFQRADEPARAPADQAAPPPSVRTLPPDPIRGTPPPPAMGSDSPPGLGAGTSIAPGVTPPKLPDLSAVVSPIVRCEKIVEWIAEATGASDVFLADASGLPLAGAIYEAEARLAGSGAVATSVLGLSTALPGSASPLFELHVGEGPFFQLIGFQAGPSLYVVGLTRKTPLTPRQAHAVRLACRHALGPTLQGGV